MKSDAEARKLIKRYVTSLDEIREKLLRMDDMIDPVMGIRDWDDSCCIHFDSKKLVASADGPYTKRLVMKSALIHASTDVAVKGARPLFALDTLVGSRNEVLEMIESLRRQSEAMRIPILGGNTLFEEMEPRCSLTIVGELLVDEPIRDSAAQPGDTLALIGDPIWGEQEERIGKAKKLFETWYQILDEKIQINAAKDVTKGGLVSVVYEMEKKSKATFNLKDQIPYSFTRNLDNFLISTSGKEYEKIKKICGKNNCPIYEIGQVK